MLGCVLPAGGQGMEPLVAVSVGPSPCRGGAGQGEGGGRRPGGGSLVPLGMWRWGRTGLAQGVLRGCGRGRTHGVILLTTAAGRVPAHVAGLQERSWWPRHCGGRA